MGGGDGTHLARNIEEAHAAQRCHAVQVLALCSCIVSCELCVSVREGEGHGFQGMHFFALPLSHHRCSKSNDTQQVTQQGWAAAAAAAGELAGLGAPSPILSCLWPYCHTHKQA